MFDGNLCGMSLGLEPSLRLKRKIIIYPDKVRACRFFLSVVAGLPRSFGAPVLFAERN